jgi:hypothetical protein
MRTAGLTTGPRTRAILRLHQNAKNVHATHVVAKTLHFLNCAHPKVGRIGRSGQAERYDRGLMSIDKVNRFLLAAVRLLLQNRSPADGQSEAMELTASRRTILFHMSSIHQSAASRALIYSHPLIHRYPRGFGKPGLGFACVTAVYVAVPQTAPFARGSSSCSR